MLGCSMLAVTVSLRPSPSPLSFTPHLVELVVLILRVCFTLSTAPSSELSITVTLLISEFKTNLMDCEVFVSHFLTTPPKFDLLSCLPHVVGLFDVDVVGLASLAKNPLNYPL
jgi:hypothetical protein